MIPPILHYSGGEPFTKYEICLIFARILGVPHAHIVADAEPPKVRLYFVICDRRVTMTDIIHQQDGTPRPRDCQLYTRETEDLMEGYGGLGWTPFDEWWTEYLTKKQ